MTGEFIHSIDAKGRLFIPSRLRGELGEAFYVTVSMEKCLSVYSQESWDVFTRKCDAMPYVKQWKMRPLFALAARCEIDAQGRTVLPQNLRRFAGLERDVAVVGCNNHAEIWDLERWQEINSQELTPENIAAVMEELDF
ncbi:MAG: division/cell wall cluster transcriptional repressor MraZ [Clostridiales bacterium]|nr:division/cell wall cluster transcriptional repressor MraZ [Candidatus Apopatocola equi]